jgi:multiple sugar transport system permease protein
MLGQRLSRSLFLLPALIAIAIIAVYPTIRTIHLSLFTPEGDFDPIKNYAQVLSDRDMIDPKGPSRGFPLGALPHNFIWIFIHLPLTTFLGLILAVILRGVRGSGFIKSVIFLGMVIPMIVGGLLLRFMFDKDIGIVNAFLSLFGLTPKSWTIHPDTALLALALGSVWLWTGFSLVLYSAGLATIPKDFYDAAKVDGATPWQIFFKITLPLLKPITVVVVVMTIMWELKIFDVVYAATRGGPGGASNVLALQMYFYAFTDFNFNYAAVVATLLLVLTIIAAIPMIRRSI